MFIGFTKMKDSGYDEAHDVYYIVMNKLDEDLNAIIKGRPEQILTLQSTINIGLQLLDRLEILHEHGIVHRDLKPKNIMLDYSKQEVNLIDFGLSASYLNQNFVHIPFRSTGTIIGTPLFASNNALMGKEISRRDDIESMVYILIFCIKG
jgi:serine/threonine protein kinase